MITALEHHPARNTLWTVANLTAAGILGNNSALGWASVVFNENLSNDGSIENTIEATLSEDSLTQASGPLTEFIIL